MLNRAANATIKGYFYQFDHSIIQLLTLANMHDIVRIEGTEDIDIITENEETLIQCKYYEGSDYNHSIIKDAIIQMLKHFKENGAKSASTIKYRIYGHYRSGHAKLPTIIDVDFAKQHFFTYKEKKLLHEVHNELGVSDSELSTFLKFLEIDINAKNYRDQSNHILDFLKAKLPNHGQDDLECFYYPLALDVIRKLAINPNESERAITGKKFLECINKKEIIFDSWLIKYLGDEAYKKYLKKKYFTHSGTKIEKRDRFFIIDGSNEFQSCEFIDVLGKISNKYSHTEHKQTSSSDRFCPYVCIMNISDSELISLKKYLKSSGVNFIDGYAFRGAEFDVKRMSLLPANDYLIKLKILDSINELSSTLQSAHGHFIEVFDFYKCAPIDSDVIPEHVIHNKIRIDAVTSIKEIIK